MAEGAAENESWNKQRDSRDMKSSSDNPQSPVAYVPSILMPPSEGTPHLEPVTPNALIDNTNYNSSSLSVSNQQRGRAQPHDVAFWQISMSLSMHDICWCPACQNFAGRDLQIPVAKNRKHSAASLQPCSLTTLLEIYATGTIMTAR